MTQFVWWLWIAGVLAVWLVVATLAAVVIGRGIRLADERSPASAGLLSTAELTPAPAPARTRRRAVPLPPVGVALAAAAVALMGTGFVLRLNGTTGPVAQLLSMDAELSLPRMFVALLFAVAALAALAGASRMSGRRTWWTAVAVVAAGIATVKAGGSIHVDGMTSLADAVGSAAAVAVSGALALAVVAALWVLSRHERRDRRRVLGSLGGYAVAAVGLSALTYVVPANLATTTTFIEESGEALAGVSFLMAVLIGVAPRLVLPADWAMRRSADAETLDIAEVLPGRPAEGLTRS
ncbi:hypothetical protein [Blastococcus sp. TF02A-35]|uniref:hypothetical protein n=1 Tax=Blastococcus sp. TF02A-35 TaxID=2559612 RepID=UPI001073466C|nr:hypothetical protein [Blastococcus sp. TF02A_35]TFV53706.1 hypothetical protein E4P43_00155 [Blastococcus sp. TF02A_35]